MTEFHVEYRIEVDADSPEDAARQVATMLANGGAERGVYQVSLHSDVLQHQVIDVDLSEDEGSFEDGDRECSRCGEEVSILNSQDECLGCEEERAQHRVCISCDETIADGEQGFRWVDGCQICGGCAHDAYRSGWSGDSVNSAHPHGF